ncbi:MAG: C45 family peptidase [Microbacteriaceae bacterium]|jgi:hypothetical protein|nr:C45 family peptidase [Microbacteriaceae bacterium]
MGLEIRELGTVSGLPWTLYAGSRLDVFTALGRDQAFAIRAARDMADGSWAVNRRRAARPDVAPLLHRVEASTRILLPVESAELDAIAAGAGLPTRDLWAYNLRGDLGRDGTGCSDLCRLIPGGVVFGHNEDGGPSQAGTMQLLTLLIEGDPAVTALWYPGMLPANACTVTGAGLAFGMDHVPIPTPDTGGVGRHFLARHAQRQSDADSALEALRETPAAGGFSFDVADLTAGTGTVLEAAAGRHAEVVAARDRTLRHTNHLHLLDGPGLTVQDTDPSIRESRARGAALDAAATRVPAGAGPVETLHALRSPGVLGRDADRYTLATVVVDSATGTILVQGEGGPETARLGDVLLGAPDAFSPLTEGSPA